MKTEPKADKDPAIKIPDIGQDMAISVNELGSSAGGNINVPHASRRMMEEHFKVVNKIERNIRRIYRVLALSLFFVVVVAIIVGEVYGAEPVVDITSDGRVDITGADYAIIRPMDGVIAGEPITLANMAWADAQGEISFSLDQNTVYTLKTAMIGDDGDAEFTESTIGQTRAEKIERYFRILIEAQGIRAELGQISAEETWEALTRIRAGQEQENASVNRKAVSRDSRDDQGNEIEGASSVLDPEPIQSGD